MSRWHKPQQPDIPCLPDPRMADAQRALADSEAQLGMARRVAAAVARVADAFDGIREHDHYSELFEHEVGGRGAE